MPDPDDTSDSTSRWRWLWAAAAVCLGGCGWLEALRLRSIMEDGGSLTTFLLYWDMETTLPFVVLLLLPILVWRGRSDRPRKTAPAQATAAPRSHSVSKTIFDCAVVCAISVCCSWWIGSRPIDVQTDQGAQNIAFADLPPAYHDEYSYLLQARTFLQGRLSYPPATVRPDLFHQFHVLNEDRTVSRYFPWTGLWIAPFEAFGHPFWGHWLAGGLAAAFFYLSMRHFMSRSVSLLAGFLIAVSPGLAIFSNLLLAHHPTMLALSVFLCGFLRMMATLKLRWAFVAGTALTLAMLGRPMTAAGFGLPFGIWLVYSLVRSRRISADAFAVHRRLIAGFAVPLICGFAALAILNHDATGRWTRTAYQEYTDRYTPRHRYGFGNGDEASEVPGPPAIQKYNEWAKNLTPAEAMRNVWSRLRYSLFWSLSSVPILFAVIISGRLLKSRSGSRPGDASTSRNDLSVGDNAGNRIATATGLKLLAGATVCLHAVHVPYWFDGIMHWHYVFETAPLMLMLTAVGIADATTTVSQRTSPRLAVAWTGMFVGVSLLPGWVSLPEFGDTSKASAAIQEQAFSRTRFAYFNNAVRSESMQKPALVLVDERDTDPQLSYVINPPDLQGPVLICRRPATDQEIQDLRQEFPDRTLYVFDPNDLRFRPIGDAAP
ncbi:ArnT family glycosyltransferase [Fuerstiella marisgermanici]|uniref:Uncharacterized protein n=1 Tax=Fuerstiella marisgermanici TaxID=1891926 RepID=A0A1P8WFH3_9PLAN|nr:glycosyltransferase family 39 protein [Fuerstiella marisgermanici]APZ92780.1 hypothetical protein Fuma_02392 [Fuerstiella marisgermanici]